MLRNNKEKWLNKSFFKNPLKKSKKKFLVKMTPNKAKAKTDDLIFLFIKVSKRILTNKNLLNSNLR